MAQSLSHVLLHVVFSTKHREPLITDALEPRLHEYMGGILRGIDCPSVKIGGTADHIHTLLLLSRTMTIADVAKEYKQSSSTWMKDQGATSFAWQAGYGAFSVSSSRADEVIAYISSQREHHRHMSFQDEFRAFLKRHEVAYDERYVWE